MKTRDVNRRERRGDKLIQERRHDPYQSRTKLTEPSVCETCGAVFSGGRWAWHETGPAEAERVTCPACHRVADNYPAGEVLLSGSYLDAHRDEIVRLMRNTEANEKQLHPLERIMDIQDADDGVKVTTTGLHLPRWIGHALEDAHKGELDTHYDEAGYFVRVSWNRTADH